jgi:hypothetical protein
MEESVHRQLVLHYIDKTHSTYVEISKTVNKVSVFLILFSLLVIAISIGVISANQEVSVAGMKLEITYWVILLSSVWVIGCCFAYMAALFCHASYIQNTILRLYASIGFSDETLNKKPHTLVNPDPLTLMSLHIENKGFR